MATIGRLVNDPEKLAPFVGLLGVPAFKGTKERNFSIRDTAKVALAWLLRVRENRHQPITATIGVARTLYAWPLPFMYG